MKQFAEVFDAIDMNHYDHGYTNGNGNGKDWHSDAVIPLSDEPEDKGLYVVTTLDRFFELDFEKSRNGNGNGTRPVKV